MALQPESKVSNVQKSLTAYLRAKLVTTEGLTVVFPLEPITTRPTEWVVIDYLLGVRQEFGRQVGTRLGGRAHGIINVNLCKTRQSLTNLYALATMRDKVAAYLQGSQTIALKDYDTGGTPTIGQIIVGSTTEAVVDDGLTSGVLTQALSVAITHVEAFSLV